MTHSSCNICDYQGCSGSDCVGNLIRTGDGTFTAPTSTGTKGYYACPGGAYDTIDVVDCGVHITADTTLKYDITGCTGTVVYIDASGVTLDCDGHRLQTSGSGGVNGINVNSKSNVVIDNCVIDMTSSLSAGAIWLDHSDGATVRNCNLDAGHQTLGLMLNSECRVENNIINARDYRALDVFFSDNNVITGNTLTAGGQSAIRINSGSNNQISGGSISAPDHDYLLQDAGDTNTFRDTDFSSPREIRLVGSSDPLNSVHFIYNDRSSGGPWLDTSIDRNSKILTRQINSWSNDYIEWSEDTTGSSTTDVTYEVSNMDSSMFKYSVYATRNGDDVFLLKPSKDISASPTGDGEIELTLDSDGYEVRVQDASIYESSEYCPECTWNGDTMNGKWCQSNIGSGGRCIKGNDICGGLETQIMVADDCVPDGIGYCHNCVEYYGLEFCDRDNPAVWPCKSGDCSALNCVSPGINCVPDSEPECILRDVEP